MCDENLPKLVGMFEMYHARLMGIAHCIVPQLLPIVIDPQSSRIQAPTMELIESIMKQNQQMPLGGSQMPSIVQIIVPAHSLQHIPVTEKTYTDDDAFISPKSSTPTIDSELLIDDSLNDTIAFSAITSEDPLRSSISIAPILTSSTSSHHESEKEDEIDDIQLNEELENDDKNKRQRDRSDFKYVESFESEKTILQKFEPDPVDNETELKQVMEENQIPSVLPVPKALSSSKDNQSEDSEPSKELSDENINEPNI